MSLRGTWVYQHESVKWRGGLSRSLSSKGLFEELIPKQNEARHHDLKAVIHPKPARVRTIWKACLSFSDLPPK